MSETYAIIRDSGHELKVAEGETVLVDLRAAEAGEEITFPDVLLLSASGEITIGQPMVDGASVVAEVKGPIAMKKLYPYKFKRRKGYHRKIGHRQKMLEVVVRSIRTA